MTGLAGLLTDTWEQQARDGFLLSDPATAEIEERTSLDPISGVEFRFRWMPHREIRTDVAELERRGILNPDRDEAALFRDPRDPSGRHCFLCEDNIAVCHPKEILLPVSLAGREYRIGANFAWIEADHFTVMAADHVDQTFTPHALAAMLELHAAAGGEFRVIYNGAEAGATIPWHLHYQVTSERLPVEGLGDAKAYPVPVERFTVDGDPAAAVTAVQRWESADPNRRVNILIAGPVAAPVVHVFRRDRRRTRSDVKGLMGGFEICGDFVYSEPGMRRWFEEADAAMARRALEDVAPA